MLQHGGGVGQVAKLRKIAYVQGMAAFRDARTLDITTSDGKASTLDISPLRLTRFEENDPVKTPYAYGVMG